MNQQLSNTKTKEDKQFSFPAEQQFPKHCGNDACKFQKLSHSWQNDSCRSVAPTMWTRSNIHIPSINRVCMFKKYFNSLTETMTSSFRSVAKHSQSQHQLSAFTIPASTQCASSRNLFHSPQKDSFRSVASTMYALHVQGTLISPLPQAPLRCVL